MVGDAKPMWFSVMEIEFARGYKPEMFNFEYTYEDVNDYGELQFDIGCYHHLIEQYKTTRRTKQYSDNNFHFSSRRIV